MRFSDSVLAILASLVAVTSCARRQPPMPPTATSSPPRALGQAENAVEDEAAILESRLARGGEIWWRAHSELAELEGKPPPCERWQIIPNDARESGEGDGGAGGGVMRLAEPVVVEGATMEMRLRYEGGRPPRFTEREIRVDGANADATCDALGFPRPVEWFVSSEACLDRTLASKAVAAGCPSTPSPVFRRGIVLALRPPRGAPPARRPQPSAPPPLPPSPLAQPFRAALEARSAFWVGETCSPRWVRRTTRGELRIDEVHRDYPLAVSFRDFGFVLEEVPESNPRAKVDVHLGCCSSPKRVVVSALDGARAVLSNGETWWFDRIACTKARSASGSAGASDAPR